MNTKKRNPKKDPVAGDLIWQPNGRNWNSVQVLLVDDGLVEYARCDRLDATMIVPLEDWREHTSKWRMAYPYRYNPMRTGLAYRYAGRESGRRDWTDSRHM